MSHSADSSQALITTTKRFTFPKDDFALPSRNFTNEQIVNFAFDSLLSLHDNLDDLSEALTAATEKVETLREERNENNRRLGSIFEQLNRAVEELDNVTEMTEEDPDVVFKDAAGQQTYTRSLSDSISAIDDSIRNSAAVKLLQARSKESKMNIAKAMGLVKMLEQAQIIARAGGMKRRREESKDDEEFSEDEDAKEANVREAKRVKIEDGNGEGMLIIVPSTSLSPGTLSAEE